MRFQIASLFEGEVALIATKGLLFGVLIKQMICQAFGCLAEDLTLIATKGFFFGVHSQMVFQIASPFAGEVTLIATKRFIL